MSRTIKLSQCRYLSNYKKILTWYSNLVKPKPRDPPFDHIIQIGDPTLRTVSENIPPNLIKLDEVQLLVKCLKNVMKKYKSFGLSAPQIGIPLQLFAFEINQNHLNNYKNNENKIKEISLTPLTVVINPEIKITDYNKIVFPESCESVKGFTADVPRYRSLDLKGYNEKGDIITIKATGWLSRIIQHEMDHLNGIMYTDKMDRKSFACNCWQVINERDGKVELPYSAQ